LVVDGWSEGQSTRPLSKNGKPTNFHEEGCGSGIFPGFYGFFPALEVGFSVAIKVRLRQYSGRRCHGQDNGYNKNQGERL
jgi:hypothetical protein